MNVRSPRNLAALAAGAVLSILVAAPAQARDTQGSATARSTAPARTCGDARAFAYFQRQLRMTEGDNEPLLPAEPAECGAMRMGEARSGAPAPTPKGGEGETRKVSAFDASSILYLGGA